MFFTEEFQSHGMVFLWTPKEELARTVSTMLSAGYQYVENLIWVRKYANNRVRPMTVAQSSEAVAPLTGTVKQTLLFFRRFKKGRELELRHQRTADVVIDFVKPPSTWTQAEDLERKPDRIYETIETLLPNAVYSHERKEGRLLELWARKGAARRHWTAVFEAV